MVEKIPSKKQLKECQLLSGILSRFRLIDRVCFIFATAAKHLSISSVAILFKKNYFRSNETLAREFLWNVDLNETLRFFEIHVKYALDNWNPRVGSLWEQALKTNKKYVFVLSNASGHF